MEEEFEKMVQNYLDENHISYEKNSIEYDGIRKDYELERGNPQSYHFLSFTAITDQTSDYGFQTWFLFIQEETNQLAYLLGPSIFEKITS